MMVAVTDSPLKPGSRSESAKVPTVGVVLPVCNGARTVGAAIESILAQTYGNWRLYVVIDRSSDQTVSIVRGYERDDARIVVIENPERRGLAYALNVGWRTATEPLIARADADDLCMAERLERQVAYLTQYPAVAVLGTGVLLARDDGSEAGVHRRPAAHEELVRKIFRECPFMHPSVMMRRSFLETMGGYNETLRVAEDYDLWLRGAHAHRYANLQELLVRYTVSGSSSSTKWGHTLGAVSVLLRHGAAHRRRLESVYYSARYMLAGALTRARLRRRRL